MAERSHREAVAQFVIELRKHPPVKIVFAFRAAQEQRVAAYAQFDASLASMLEAGCFDSYGNACSTATAAFANCSANAAAAAEALREAGALEPSQIISKIQVLYPIITKACQRTTITKVLWSNAGGQALEAEKLTLTAALHLDIIRGRQLGPEEELSASEAQALLLLQETQKSSEKKMALVVGAINQALDDLTAELSDLLED